MKNMYSPYQQRKAGVLPRLYTTYDVLLIREKILKMEKIIMDENVPEGRRNKADKLLNQQNLERCS